MPEIRTDVVRSYTDRSTSAVEVFKQYSEMADKALAHIWLPEEVKVEKDKQCMLTEMTPAEYHGIVTTLKLFTLYELKAGNDYWGNRYKRIMKGPEFHRLASVYTMYELAVHKPFYSKINEALSLDSDEFYTEYTQDPILSSRMEFIGRVLDDPNDLVSIGAFSMVEGGILYSNFAFLKHFSSNGKNKVPNIGRGINFTVSDESEHQQAGALTFRHLYHDAMEDGCFQQLYGDPDMVKARLVEAAKTIYEHEAHVIDLVFEKGDIEGISSGQLRVFVRSRLNNCIQDLGYDAIWPEEDNPIGEWFYDNITSYQSNDFFAGIGNAYNRSWPEDEFLFKQFDPSHPTPPDETGEPVITQAHPASYED